LSAHLVESDVLIVGGGLAGCVAAIRAAEAGATVVVVDKARSIRRSGDAGRGLAFLTTYLDLGEPWDTPEAFAEWYCDIAEGLVDMEVAWPLAIDPLPAIHDMLEESGVDLHNADGGYDRVDRMWAPGPIVVKFDGQHIKPRLATRAEAYASANPGCLVQVAAALGRAKRPLPAFHPVELFDASIRNLGATQLLRGARR